MYYENGQMKLSRQAEIDKRMCKPGYTWSEMSWRKDGGKCLPAYGGVPDTDKPPKGPGGPPDALPTPPPPTDGTQPGDATVAKEVAARKAVK